ncbi:hypothetical protein BDW59DRAFT_158852 [Aspergillus cavernicola]|uniref:Uncharacterized protein n=1 Tax=Aspergillus cavernicola TaxID=176166 RepID=A0ABR4IPJ4_9EURO
MFYEESEDTDGELTIKEYLSRSDPFRATTSNQPWPYPPTITPAELTTVEQVNALKTEMLRIIEDDGFPAVEHLTFEIVNVSKPEYPLGHRTQTTLAPGGVCPNTLSLGSVSTATHAIDFLSIHKS